MEPRSELWEMEPQGTEVNLIDIRLHVEIRFQVLGKGTMPKANQQHNK